VLVWRSAEDHFLAAALTLSSAPSGLKRLAFGIGAGVPSLLGAQLSGQVDRAGHVEGVDLDAVLAGLELDDLADLGRFLVHAVVVDDDGALDQ
jgi:hypothetical protein